MPNSKDWSSGELVDDTKMDALEGRTIASFDNLTTRQAFAPMTAQQDGRMYWVAPYGYLTNVQLGGNYYLAPMIGTVVVHMSAGITTNVATATNTVIGMDTAGKNWNISGSSTGTAWFSTSTFRFTPQVPGMYKLEGGVAFGPATGVGVRQAFMRLNGNSPINGSSVTVPGLASTALQVPARPTVQYFNGSSDYAELCGFQSSGQAITAQSNGSGSNIASSFTATYVGYVYG